MVHPFTFNFRDKTFYYLWDVESGSLHEVNEAAFFYAKQRYIDGNLNTTNDKLKKTFDSLEEENVLNAKPLNLNYIKNTEMIKALCLHVCHDCNMNCDYCFAGGGKYSSPNDYMSFETAKQAVDFLITNSGNNSNVEIDFFGGEPLLNFKVIQKTVDYAKERAKRAFKNIYFTISTNCLLLNKARADYLNEHMDNIVLSIDGRKEIHNFVRHTLKNKDAHDLIIKNAKYLVDNRKDKKYYVRGTFTNNNYDFLEDVKFLHNLGFKQISIEPVVLPNNHPLSISKDDLPEILKEYDRLAQYYLDQRLDNNWFNFFHYMIDLENGPCLKKRLNACGAGVDYLAITPTGEIYPCHQFVGKIDYKLGNLDNGIEKQKIRQLFLDNCVLSKSDCAKCPAKYYCSGGCPANALEYTGEISGTNDIYCQLIIKRFENSLALAAIEKN